MKILITAGGTREFIDPVRFISNASSGKMGYALARVALERGHEVTLISGPTHLEPPAQARVISVISAQDMLEAVQQEIGQCDCLIMAAAVSDYTVAHPSTSKLKKAKLETTLELKPTQDILQWIATTRNQQPETNNQIIVGFALEDRDVRSYAEDKLERKKLDMIVANGPEAIGAEGASIEVKVAGCEWISYEAADKRTQAQRILNGVEDLW